MIWSFWQLLPTWVWELSVAGFALAVTAYVSGAGLVQWLAALAVTLTFAHVQVATRLREAEVARTEVVVHCHVWLDRYLVAKEAAWVVVFMVTSAWPAVVGCGLFLLYPVWRQIYNRLRADD